MHPNPLQDEDRERIEFMLREIEKYGGDLSDNDLDWADTMSDAYEEQGFLTERQLEVLENIYGKIS